MNRAQRRAAERAGRRRGGTTEVTVMPEVLAAPGRVEFRVPTLHGVEVLTLTPDAAERLIGLLRTAVTIATRPPEDAA